MNLHARIERLEAQRREREAAGEPRRLQHADHDAEGNVVACEQFVFPVDPPDADTLGPMVAGFRAMRRIPFSRSTCPYTDCDKRDTCRADGRLTRWERGNNRNNRNE